MNEAYPELKRLKGALNLPSETSLWTLIAIGDRRRGLQCPFNNRYRNDWGSITAQRLHLSMHNHCRAFVWKLHTLELKFRLTLIPNNRTMSAPVYDAH